MESPPDALELDFDPERSRAAVAVACLEWLRCTGPATSLGVGDRPREASAMEVRALDSDQVPRPHPLWDRWLDG